MFKTKINFFDKKNHFLRQKSCLAENHFSRKKLNLGDTNIF